MVVKRSGFSVLILTATIAFSISACGGRLAPPPELPPIEDPAPNPDPNPDPVGDPDQPDVEPPNGDDPPVDNPGDGTSDLPAPDPGQPNNSVDFFKMMEMAGFELSKDEIIADITKLSTMEIKEWSPGIYKDMDKNIQVHFEKYGQDYGDLDTYISKSMELAAQTENLHFYIESKYGPRNNTIYLIKVNPETKDVLYFNKSGNISNFTKDQGGLLRLSNAIFIPKSIMKSPAVENLYNRYFKASPYNIYNRNYQQRSYNSSNNYYRR